MVKNGASQKIELFCFDTSLGTPKVADAANLTAYVAKDFAAASALADTSATEIDATNAKGWYVFDLAQAETNADHLLFTGKSSTANVAVVGRPVETAPANFAAQSINSSGQLDVIKINGTSQTARDLGASVLLSSGTGTGQLDFTAGVVKANLAQILGTALTETAGQIAAAVKKFFNVASPASTMEKITGVGLVDTLTAYTGNTPQTGDSYARIGAAGASLTALGDTRLANLDATVSSRSTYAGGDTAGTGTLLTRLTSTRAGLLDNLDAAITTRMATFSYTVPPTAVSIRQEIDSNSTKLDAAVSSRMATFSYTAPDNADIVTALADLVTLLGRTDPTTALSAVKTVMDHLATALELNAGNYRFTTAALANAPAGGGGSGSLTTDQAAQLSETHTRTLLALPNAAPGATTGLARTEDVQVTLVSEN